MVYGIGALVLEAFSTPVAWATVSVTAVVFLFVVATPALQLKVSPLPRNPRLGVTHY